MEDYNFKEDIINKIEKILKDSQKETNVLKELKNLKTEYSYENIHTCFEVCPDNYIGDIEGEKFISPNDRYKASKEEKTSQLGKSAEENIIILLESPHIDEFKKNLTAPALGETGNRLNSYLEDLLKNYLVAKSKAKLFLVNAIQYQCSLGFSTDCVRNFVFNQLFNEDTFKKDLKERIDKQNPKIIVIATTSFCRKKIKDWVLNEYKDNKVSIYEADSHPSVWTSKTKITACE